MRLGLAVQGCESKYVAWFHKVAANVEKDLEGQKRKRGRLSGLDSVDVINSMAWIGSQRQVKK